MAAEESGGWTDVKNAVSSAANATASSYLAGLGAAVVGIPMAVASGDVNAIPQVYDKEFERWVKIMNENYGLEKTIAPTTEAGQTIVGVGAKMGEKYQSNLKRSIQATGASTTVGGALYAASQVLPDLYDKIKNHPSTGHKRDIFGGVQSDDPMTRNRIDQAMAMEAEGKPMDEIMDKTGAFKSRVDGMWRAWVSDEGATLDLSVAQRKGKGNIPNGTTVKLGAVLNHDVLYQNYPSLKNMDVEFDVREYKGGQVMENYGAYYPKDNKIVIYLDKNGQVDKGQLINTLTHEAQHAVQKIEGHVGGTSIEDMSNVLMQAFPAEQRVKMSKALTQLSAAARKGDGAAEEDAALLRLFVNPRDAYEWNAGEVDAHLSGTFSGQPESSTNAPVRLAFEGHNVGTAHGTEAPPSVPFFDNLSMDQIEEITKAQSPEAVRESLVNSMPGVWGNERVLNIVFDGDKNLVQKYLDKAAENADTGVVPRNDVISEQRTFHASKTKWEGNPDVRHMGTGEGAQVYGWGHYSAEKLRTIEEHYFPKFNKNAKVSDWVDAKAAEKYGTYGLIDVKDVNGDTVTIQSTSAIKRESLGKLGEELPVAFCEASVDVLSDGGLVYFSPAVTDVRSGWDEVKRLYKGADDTPRTSSMFQYLKDEADGLSTLLDHVRRGDLKMNKEGVIHLYTPSADDLKHVKRASAMEWDVPENNQIMVWGDHGRPMGFSDQHPDIQKKLEGLAREENKPATDRDVAITNNILTFVHDQSDRDMRDMYFNVARKLRNTTSLTPEFADYIRSQGRNPEALLAAVKQQNSSPRGVRLGKGVTPEEELASHWFAYQGILGHKFPDGYSRGKDKRPTYNHVTYGNTATAVKKHDSPEELRTAIKAEVQSKKKGSNGGNQ